jgi:hypothetical protein
MATKRDLIDDERGKLVRVDERTEHTMSFEVETRDCTSLSDNDLSEMADLSAGHELPFDIGFLSKQCEEWVLITTAREAGKLRGYSFCTLERIGGTPSMLIGVASVDRTAKAEQTLRHLLADQYRRALLAFPDEDVLVGVRLAGARGYQMFDGLTDVVPRPGHKATGEERAWARRLAKRFGAEHQIDDRTFVLSGTGDLCGALDFDGTKVPDPDAAVVELFAGVDVANGDRLVGFGWAMAEDLASGSLPRRSGR